MMDPWRSAQARTLKDTLGECFCSLFRNIPSGTTYLSPWNRLRTVGYRWAGMTVGPNSILFPGIRVICPSRIVIGAHSFCNAECLLSGYGRIFIGNHVAIGYRCSVITETHAYESSDFQVKTLPVRIADYAWIGSGVTILPGVEIGVGAVVAAGSVVTKSVASGTVVAGVPARPLPGKKGRPVPDSD